MMMPAVLFLVFILSALSCYWLVRQQFNGWMDKPGERSLHHYPTPRLGGVAIWGSISIGICFSGAALGAVPGGYWILSAAALWLIAILDDKTALSPLVKLLAQCVVGILSIWGGELYFSSDTFYWLWPLLGLFVLIWGVNLYNFMDGMDGLAACMAVTGFGTLAILGVLQGHMSFTWLCGLIVAGTAGFLCFNLPPARIFMGDSGSTLLGYAMVTVSVIGWKQGLYPIWTPLILFSPFIVDASLTLLSRMLRLEKIWLPHRQHYYQRWVLAGFSHRYVLVAYVAVMVACDITVIAWQQVGIGYNEGIPVLACVGFYALAWLCGRRLITH
jgi:UDP-N-acetylmuramyl pentapeptide phosphotransferase/UDP-N-acetylglucosamine-1-phosphate transferase